MTLNEEIDKARLQVHTDSYPMSIGEMVNLYRDGDLDIHPEFQRVYRWSPEQKSRLIESILLGIPLPSIFVSQRTDGVWDVVDGLQRLSTIFSFLGELKGDDDNLLQPLELKATKYLPSLNGKVWEGKHNPSREIHADIKRVFKREKLDIKMIKRESESDTKLELFQRLNTGGSRLSDQEVRNCMLLMINPDRFDWVQSRANDLDFINTLPLSSKQIEEKYRHELFLRFIVQRHYSEDIRKENSDVGPYLDAELNRIFSSTENIFDYDNEERIFKETFQLCNEALDEKAFKKYNQTKERWEGAVSIPVFEALTTAVSFYIQNNPEYEREELKDKIITTSQMLTSTDEFSNPNNRSIRPLDRMVIMVTLGKDLIK